jgi:excisionase family DNA binding protein
MATENGSQSIEHLPSPWMNPAQLATYLGVAIGTVHNWTSARYIPHCRRGRVVRFHREAVDRWLTVGGCPGRRTFADPVS